MANVTRGLVQVDPAALELMRSTAASEWQVLRKVRVPNALPYFFTAMKLAKSETAAITDAPLVATHSNAHALAGWTRNLTDRQLKAYGAFELQILEELLARIIWNPLGVH